MAAPGNGPVMLESFTIDTLTMRRAVLGDAALSQEMLAHLQHGVLGVQELSRRRYQRRT